jgi:hypothetical protein
MRLASLLWERIYPAVAEQMTSATLRLAGAWLNVGGSHTFFWIVIFVGQLRITKLVVWLTHSNRRIFGFILWRK